MTEPPPDLKLARLMFVEDSDEDWRLTELLFRRIELENDRCRVVSGEQAMQVLTVFEPDIVFLDFSLPGESGPGVARRIAAAEQASAIGYAAEGNSAHDRRPLFVALTHSSDPLDFLEASVASQFFGYFTKHLTIEKIERLNASLRSQGLELRHDHTRSRPVDQNAPTEPAPG